MLTNREEKKKITVGIFIDTFYPMVDGVIQVVDNYAKILQDKCKVIVFAPKGRDKNYKDNHSYPVIRSKKFPIFFLDYDLPIPQLDRAFKKRLKSANLDIVHIHSPFAIGKMGIKYAKKHNIPVVATMHSQFKKDLQKNAKTPLLTPIVAIMMAMIRKVFNSTTENWAVNSSVGKIFHEEYKVKGIPLVMNNGTDFCPVENKEECAQRLKEQYKINSDEKVLLFVGRLDLLKNLEFLINSLKSLKDRSFKYKMLFIGTGVDEEVVKKQASDLGLDDVVTFVGKISDRKVLAEHFALADLFLFPSMYDCSSLAQVEAASQGTPTLFLEGSATSATVTPDVNGYLSIDDVDAYAEKVIEIFSNEEHYKQVCENAVRDLYWPWNKVVNQAYERYLYLIDKVKTESDKK